MAKGKINPDDHAGLFEVVLRFEPRDGGEPEECVTTPSMWATADEWADGLRVGPKPHSNAWVAAKMTDAVFLQAAMAAGIVKPGPIDLVRIAEMNNLFEVVDVKAVSEAAEGDGAGNA